MAHRLGKPVARRVLWIAGHRLVRSAVPSFAPDLVSEHHLVLVIWRVRSGQYAK
jgi:hypothetical protein